MRTYAKNRFERCVQVLRWLNEEFDLFEDGSLRFEFVDMIEATPQGKDALEGCVFEHRGKLVVQISARTCRTTSHAIAVLIPEAAHIALWSTGRGLLHGDEFWRTYGRMADAYDHHGCQDSKTYYVD